MSQGCFNVSLFLWHIWGFILCFVNIFVNRNKALFQHLALEIYCCANYMYTFIPISSLVLRSVYLWSGLFLVFFLSVPPQHFPSSDLYRQHLFSLLAVVARVVCVVFWWRGTDQDVFGGDLRLFKNLQFCTYTNEMIQRYFSIFRIQFKIINL